jgi:hypothetical protein
MSIAHSVRKQLTGLGLGNYGVPTGYNPSLPNQLLNVSLSTSSAQNNALSITAPVAGLTRGKYRIRIYSFGGTNPTVIARAYLYDGTNAVDVLLPESAFAPTLTTSPGPCGIDLEREFITEITATSLCVVTTLGGTSPTAQMDVECYGPE